MVYIISMEKQEGRNGLNINDLLRNSLNNNLSLSSKFLDYSQLQQSQECLVRADPVARTLRNERKNIMDWMANLKIAGEGLT